MKKKLMITTILSAFFIMLTGNTIIKADVGEWGEFGSNPTQILESIKNKSNDGEYGYEIQETNLDGFSISENDDYKLYATFDWIRKHILYYLQWIVYIGLSVAVILLIYNGALLIFTGKTEKAKGNITNILIGTLILTSFYAILDIILSVLNILFN